MTTFHVGDVVRLKSGGPLMTIDGIPTSNIVNASWFVGTTLQEGNFPQDLLEVVPNGSSEVALEETSEGNVD